MVWRRRINRAWPYQTELLVTADDCCSWMTLMRICPRIMQYQIIPCLHFRQGGVSTFPPSCWVKTSPDSHNGRRRRFPPLVRVPENDHQLPGTDMVVTTVHCRAHQIVEPGTTSTKWRLPICLTLRTWVINRQPALPESDPVQFPVSQDGPMAGDLLTRGIPQTIIMFGITASSPCW